MFDVPATLSVENVVAEELQPCRRDKHPSQMISLTAADRYDVTIARRAVGDAISEEHSQ